MNNEVYFSTEGGAQLDGLSAYDHSGIGREFVAVAPNLTQMREHEERRAQLMIKNWADTLTESQRIPKSNLRRSCKYETQKVASQSMMTVFLYLVSASCAGVVIAWVLKHLNM